MKVVTRFAPSPTGFLHIGGARTALFNWLYARHMQGRFLLRIEDTDKKRSTQEAIDAILEGLSWLGLDWDAAPVYQSQNATRHADVANALLEKGHAYYCYATPDELQKMRETQKAEGLPQRYDGRWRDRDPSEAPQNIPPVIRLKAPRDGETTLQDEVQGTVRVFNQQLDDMILLRADGTPTYMLSVVVDDYDMGITHVMRGDDHLTNAFRQAQIYQLMGWQTPIFAHIPLIHGQDGAKMSKRHGAIGAEAYRDMGILPEAMRNYLLRLGWGHGDDEIISTQQAIEWFDFTGIGKAASRFDMTKLESLNAHYLRETPAEDLLPSLNSRFDAVLQGQPQHEHAETWLLKGLAGLTQRAKGLNDLAESAHFYLRCRPLPFNDKAKKLVLNDGHMRLAKLQDALDALTDWTVESIENSVKEVSAQLETKLGNIAQPLRAALTGSNVSPSIFEVAAILGKTESLGRIQDALALSDKN